MSRQYLNASRAVCAVKSGTPLKKYCGKVKIGKEEYALACETLKYADVLGRIYKTANTSAKTLDVDENLLDVMLYELLFGKGKIKSGGVVKRRIMDNIDGFKAGLKAEMIAKGTDNKIDLLSADIAISENVPKYVRINSIKTDFRSGLAELTTFTSGDLCRDEHIPSLVMIPSSKAAGLSGQEGVVSGRLIIQDKASCFPSQILSDEWVQIKARDPSRRVDMVDATAAPGNKTSHLSAESYQPSSTHEKGTFRASIFAFDRSVDRAKLLESRMKAAGADNVEVCNADFLDVDVSLSKYASVRALLVDPSCSGSGVVRSLERALERTGIADGSRRSRESNDKNKSAGGGGGDQRLQKLREFQISVVSKAMTFPAAEAVVYSTCSIHQEENESVVAELLRTHPEWAVKLPERFLQWPRRGDVVEGLTTAQSSCLVRCSPEDGMNGFFVALFVKNASQTTTVTRSPSPISGESESQAAPAAGESGGKRRVSDEEDEVDGAGGRGGREEESASRTYSHRKKTRTSSTSLWKPASRLMSLG